MNKKAATPDTAEAPKTEDTLLKETAVAIGGAAGKVAALAKSAFAHKHADPVKPAQKAGRIPPSNKTRLPRKEKKALARRKG